MTEDHMSELRIESSSILLIYDLYNMHFTLLKNTHHFFQVVQLVVCSVQKLFLVSFLLQK